MSTFDRIELAIDLYLYFTWIYIVVRYNKDWDGLLGYNEEKDKNV